METIGSIVRRLLSRSGVLWAAVGIGIGRRSRYEELSRAFWKGAQEDESFYFCKV